MKKLTGLSFRWIGLYIIAIDLAVVILLVGLGLLLERHELVIIAALLGGIFGIVAFIFQAKSMFGKKAMAQYEKDLAKLKSKQPWER